MAGTATAAAGSGVVAYRRPGGTPAVPVLDPDRARRRS